MPDENFNLKTEFSSFPRSLVIDEISELPSLLIDHLLGHGCQVIYFGKEPKENLSYLLEKNNFVYLDSLEKNSFFSEIDYLFYFPSDELSEFEKVCSLAQGGTTKVLLCLPWEFSQKDKIKALFQDERLNIRVVYFDNLFGPRIKKGLLGELFVKAVEKIDSTINEDPSREIYPLPAKELTKELVRLIFSPDTEKKEYFVCPKERMTLFSFTSLIKNFLPESSFVFADIISLSSKSQKPKGVEKVEVYFDLNEQIQETIDWFQRNSFKEGDKKEKEFEKAVAFITEEREEDKLEASFGDKPSAEQLEQKQNQEKESPVLTISPSQNLSNQNPTREHLVAWPIAKKIVFGISLFLLLAFSFFLIPLGLSFVSGYFGVREAAQIKTLVEQGNFSAAIKKIKIAGNFFAFTRQVFNLTSPFYSLVGFNRQLEIINEAFPLTQNLTTSLEKVLFAAQEATVIEKSFMEQKDINWDDEIKSLNASLSTAYEQASLIQASLSKLEPAFKFFKQTMVFEKIKEDLPRSREILLKSKSFFSVLPQILGVEGIKTYLVLFQNNMELRPTGGFIGSYGVVRLEKGRLVDFEVFDIYQADGQLKGHVEPPEDLKNYLGEAAWYMRDSNWDPDFPTTAQRAQWFLDKETQVTVDGTIALNLEAVKKLLSALGEVEVSDYQEKINAGNLFQKAEYYSELGTFPGSTQKKDFLGSLEKEIFTRMKQADTKQSLNLAGAIFSALEEKEIMLYFNDPQIEQTVANLQWEGSIRSYQPNLKGDSIFTDYLFINESNVGINKANYYVQRKIDHQITIDNLGKVKEKLTITYDNLSPSDNWPSGRYKNYLRLYLKKGTQLSSVFIEDINTPGLWEPFDPQQIRTAEEHGKTVYGLVFEIPIKEKRKIEINYELPESLSLSTKITSYLLMVQKQSGAFPSTYDLTVVYPSSFIPLRVIPSAVVGNQQLLISSKLVKDLIYQIDISH